MSNIKIGSQVKIMNSDHKGIVKNYYPKSNTYLVKTQDGEVIVDSKYLKLLNWIERIASLVIMIVKYFK